MYESATSWRKKIRLQKLVDIAKGEFELGRDIDSVYELLECEMKNRWNLVYTTRKQYLGTIDKILKNQYVLTN